MRVSLHGYPLACLVANIWDSPLSYLGLILLFHRFARSLAHTVSVHLMIENGRIDFRLAKIITSNFKFKFSRWLATKVFYSN